MNPWGPAILNFITKSRKLMPTSKLKNKVKINDTAIG